MAPGTTSRPTSVALTKTNEGDSMNSVRQLICWLTALPLLMAPAPVTAQVAVRGRTVYTMAGQPIENAMVVIKNGKIAAIGQASELNVPAGFEVLEAKLSRGIRGGRLPDSALGLVDRDLAARWRARRSPDCGLRAPAPAARLRSTRPPARRPNRCGRR